MAECSTKSSSDIFRSVDKRRRTDGDPITGSQVPQTQPRPSVLRQSSNRRSWTLPRSACGSSDPGARIRRSVHHLALSCPHQVPSCAARDRRRIAAPNRRHDQRQPCAVAKRTSSERSIFPVVVWRLVRSGIPTSASRRSTMCSPISGASPVFAISRSWSMSTPALVRARLMSRGRSKSVIAAGAAGLHIEDQVGAKRCGHRPG